MDCVRNGAYHVDDQRAEHGRNELMRKASEQHDLGARERDRVDFWPINLESEREGERERERGIYIFIIVVIIFDIIFSTACLPLEFCPQIDIILAKLLLAKSRAVCILQKDSQS